MGKDQRLENPEFSYLKKKFSRLKDWTVLSQDA
jgi:hypothetical protein